MNTEDELSLIVVTTNSLMTMSQSPRDLLNQICRHSFQIVYSKKLFPIASSINYTTRYRVTN
jgi:hypothetical protein